MTILCGGMGAACILYYIFLVLHAGIFVNFGWFWAVTGGAFLLAAFLHSIPDHPGALWASRILIAALAGLILLLGILCVVIVGDIHSTVPDNLEYAVVLGAQVRKTVPSRALLQRIEAAREAAGENPELVLILSGGQGPGEEISEARCMWNQLTGNGNDVDRLTGKGIDEDRLTENGNDEDRLTENGIDESRLTKNGIDENQLTKNGIDESRLILEERSTTTQENLRFSNQLTHCSERPCAIISNDFHLHRALKIARKEGYRDVCGISAGSELLMKPHYFVREAVALLYGKLRGTF